MSERVMIGVMVALGVNLTVSLGQAWYVVRTLDTDPPIVERVRVLELRTSELGKTMDEVKDILSDLKIVIDKVHNEQARRKPLVDYVEKGLLK